MRQGQLYFWMAWPVYERIVFIYEFKPTQAVKEFVVEYNKSLIAPLLETAKAVTIGVENGLPPSRPSWAEDPEGKVCASCEYRRTCWSLTDDEKTDDPTQSIKLKRTTSAKRKRALRSSA